MVEMAKANGVNVYHYLTYLLEKLPNDGMSDDELELLAPWNENLKAEIERRANEYSCAVTPQVRQTGNCLSGLAGTAYASLLT